jgi:translation elongation factor EF-Ts
LIKLPTINGYLKQIVSTECVGTRDFCRMLKNFYISENDIEVKTTIETAILTLRETVRTEIGKYMGKINQTDLDAPVKK